jgi:hypothetical protein
MMLGAHLVTLGFVFLYFRACLWAAVAGATGPGDPPGLGTGSLADEYFFNGLVLAVSLFVLQIAVIVWAYSAARHGATAETLVQAPLVWGLVLGALLYWPMGLGLMALRSSRWRFWDVVTGAKVMLLAFPKFAVTTLLGTLAYAVPMLLTILALGALSFAAGPVALAILPAFAAIPFVYAHGVLGALMGHLFRTSPELLPD